MGRKCNFNALPYKMTSFFHIISIHFIYSSFSITWRSNVNSLNDNFVRHISRFLGPQELAIKQQYKNPILFVGGSKSDYLTYVTTTNFY